MALTKKGSRRMSKKKETLDKDDKENMINHVPKRNKYARAAKDRSFAEKLDSIQTPQASQKGLLPTIQEETTDEAKTEIRKNNRQGALKRKALQEMKAAEPDTSKKNSIPHPLGKETQTKQNLSQDSARSSSSANVIYEEIVVKSSENNFKFKKGLNKISKRRKTKIMQAEENQSKLKDLNKFWTDIDKQQLEFTM